jgi:hypothetical protein
LARNRNGKASFRLHGYVGLAVILVAELLLLLRWEPVYTFFTPIVWTGYILLVDAIIFKIQGHSLISNHFGNFLLMLLLSLMIWLIFEFYNILIKSWHYQGLPENLLLRSFGYAWSFATILPAILLTARLVELLFLRPVPVSKARISRGAHWFLIVLGALCLTIPPVLPHSIGRYLITPVWFGFIFFLDPINRVRGGWSLLGDLERGEASRFLSLLATGLICGFLWEFWNYWAKAKWIYAVPLPLGPKLFEMPLGGYLGFLPFAVECHVMYAFVMTFRREKWLPRREV